MMIIIGQSLFFCKNGLFFCKQGTCRREKGQVIM